MSATGAHYWERRSTDGEEELEESDWEQLQVAAAPDDASMPGGYSIFWSNKVAGCHPCHFSPHPPPPPQTSSLNLPPSFGQSLS